MLYTGYNSENERLVKQSSICTRSAILKVVIDTESRFTSAEYAYIGEYDQLYILDNNHIIDISYKCSNLYKITVKLQILHALALHTKRT